MPHGANLYMSVETEQLIEMGREHLWLYDPKLPSYCDAQLVANTWQYIADILAREGFDDAY